MDVSKLDCISTNIGLSFIDKDFAKGKDVYEFGVHNGSSLRCIQNKLMELEIEYNNLIGFDSFVGFPSFEKEYQVDPNTHKPWENCDFNLVSDESSVEDVMNNIKSNFDKPPILIPGYFEDSLNDTVISINNLKPASFVHMDADLYTSSITVLEFLFKNGLIVSGTILLYDEWGPTFSGNFFGEERAHSEIAKKYGEFEFLGIVNECRAAFRKI